MIIFEDTNSFSQAHQGCVTTIGKFDGVHLGHQLILDQLKQKAEQSNLPSLVILIEPHPEEFFAGPDGECPARLTSLTEKIELLESFGIDFVFQLNFDQVMSEISAENYVREILVGGLGITTISLGTISDLATNAKAIMRSFSGQAGNLVLKLLKLLHTREMVSVLAVPLFVNSWRAQILDW